MTGLNLLFRRILRISAIVTIAVCLLVCLFSGCSGSKWIRNITWPEFTWDKLPGQDDFPEAGAVVLLDEADVEISRIGESPFSVMNRHRIVKILNEKGFRHANFIIPYDDATEIIKLEARTITPERRIIPLDPGKVFETSLYPDYVFYSDDKAKCFAMPAAEPGTVLEFRWQLQVRNFTLWTHWPFQQLDPVMISRYTIHCPHIWKVKWKCYGGEEVGPEIERESSTYDRYRWELRNINAMRPETGMPSGLTENTGLLFSPVGMEKWDDVAAWYHALARDRAIGDSAMKLVVDSLVGSAETETEKIRRIYEYVRDKVRYLAIEIGVGGYQPHPAPEVFRNLFGDCKDMATLIVTLSELAGIEADPVLISTWQNGTLDTGLVTPAQFNHAIALATLSNKSEIWMDATDKQCAFGELPWYDQDRLVLIVNDSARAVIRRTPMPVNKNQTSRSWQLDMEPDGSTDGSLSITYTGTSAANIRHMFYREPFHEIVTWCNQELLGRFPAAENGQVDVRGLDQPGDTVYISIPFRFQSAIDSSTTCLSFQPGTWSGYDWHQLFAPRERYSDILLGFPLTMEDEVKIGYPETWTLLSQPGFRSLSMPFGGYYYRISFEDHCVHYKRYFRFSETRVEKSQYADFRNFLNEAALLDQKPVVFNI
jgi:hypothetical protein